MKDICVQIKMNRMRQRIAQRLKDAQNTCAMLTTFNEIDMRSVHCIADSARVTVNCLCCMLFRLVISDFQSKCAMATGEIGKK